MGELAVLKQILLDMDGVISDFNTACLRRHGWIITGLVKEGAILENIKDEDYTIIYPYGEWEIGKVLGLSDEEMWKPLSGIFKYL